MSGLLVLLPSLVTLFIGRVLQGIVVGLTSGIVAIIIKEFSPISLSGLAGALQNTFIAMGFLTAFVLSYLLSQFMLAKNYFYFVFGFTIFTSLLQIVLLITVATN